MHRSAPSSLVFLVLAGLMLLLSLNTGWNIYSNAQGGLDNGGRPLFSDYIAFWSAGQLALMDQADQVYQLPRLMDIQQTAFPGLDVKMPFHYPPLFLLLLTPLALLPYLIAAPLFQGFTFAGLLAVFRRHLTPTNLLLILASPAVFFCVVQGQNGFLSAALLMGGLLALEKKPVLAGVFFGLLCFKPHFAILVPLLLLIGGYWRTLIAQTITVLLVALISLSLFGLESWLAFLNNSSFAMTLLTEQNHKWFRMGSAFVTIRMLGFDTQVAAIGHALWAFAGFVLVYPLWRRPEWRSFATIATPILVLLASPFQFDYDLPLLLLPLLLWRPQTHSRTSLTLIALLWLCPYLSVATSSLAGLNILPILMLAALWQIRREAGKQACQAPAQCGNRQTA